jgi:hypothetical protein
MDWSPVLTGLGSFVLTAGLVYLYKVQTEIHKQQRSLAESSHEAILRIENYQLVSEYELAEIRQRAGIKKGEIINSGAVIVEISNFGKGAADDLTTHLYFEGDELYVSVDTILNYGSHFDPLAFTGEGGVIGAEEKNIQFICEFSAAREELMEEWELPVEGPEMLSPTEMAWLMQDAGERDVEVGIEIHYEDGVGKGDPKTLFRKKIDLHKYQDFRSIENIGEPLYD